MCSLCNQTHLCPLRTKPLSNQENRTRLQCNFQWFTKITKYQYFAIFSTLPTQTVSVLTNRSTYQKMHLKWRHMTLAYYSIDIDKFGHLKFV